MASSHTERARMTKKLSSAITAWLIRQGVISKNEEELYRYASYLVITTMTPTLTVLLLGALNHISPINCLLFSCSFIVLRKYSGGFHFHSHIICFITSSIVELLFLCFANSGIPPHITHYFFILACISLIIFSPVISARRTLTPSEILRCKRMVRRILAFLFIICYLGDIIGFELRIPFPKYAVIMTAVIQYPALMRRHH